ncbi:MAG: helix-turn-helix transcriptional regulator, partial [Oscillospiraceae bacterium]|nr:helix-turn-helix transcriptional regulator [Oscillospiraceae bacterium]
MDQKMTGEFIARERHALSMTQAELADKLHISAKTVSRWETGKGMPDVSLMMP